jgi:hypothetical protein
MAVMSSTRPLPPPFHHPGPQVPHGQPFRFHLVE